MILDVHNHIGQSPDGGHGTVDELIAIMDMLGIAQSVVFATDEPGWQPTFKDQNTKVLHAQKKFPDRIIAFTRIVPSAKEAISEFNRCCDLGAKGLKLKGKDGFNPAQMREVFDVAKQKKDFPVLIHTDHEKPCQPRQLEDWVKEYPSIPFILAHGGKDHYKDCCDLAVNYHNVVIDTSTLSFNRTKYIYINAGPQKIVFASDYPYSHQAIELKKFEILINDQKEMDLILFENARKILGL